MISFEGNAVYSSHLGKALTVLKVYFCGRAVQVESDSPGVLLCTMAA